MEKLWLLLPSVDVKSMINDACDLVWIASKPPWFLSSKEPKTKTAVEFWSEERSAICSTLLTTSHDNVYTEPLNKSKPKISIIWFCNSIGSRRSGFEFFRHDSSQCSWKLGERSASPNLEKLSWPKKINAILPPFGMLFDEVVVFIFPTLASGMDPALWLTEAVLDKRVWPDGIKSWDTASLKW